MKPRTAALLALSILLVAGQAAASDFQAVARFQAGEPAPVSLEGGTGNAMVSGALDVQVRATRGAFGFFNTTGATVTGLTKVCWQPADISAFPCTDGPGPFSIVVAPGSTVGLRLPSPVSLAATTRHSMALFYDFAQQHDLNTLGLGRTVAMSAVAGTAAFGPIAAIPDAVPDPGKDGVIVTIDASSTLEVRSAGTVVHRTAGSQALLTFQGKPAIPPIGSSVMVLPFDGGTTLSARPAQVADAVTGMDPERLAASMRSIVGAAAEIPDILKSPVASIAPRVFAGSVLTLGNRTSAGLNINNRSLESFVRFDTLSAAPTAQGVTLTAAGPLVFQNGHVAGAAPLVGFAAFRMPWWSYLLWVLALAAFVAVLVRKAPKTNEKWDRLSWVGLVARPVVALLVAWLWDRQVKALIGVSLTTPHLSGPALGVVALLELVPAAAILFAVVTPLRILLRNSLRLAGQGRFMGLSMPIALLVGYFLGVTLLRAYLDVLLGAALKAAGQATGVGTA